MFPGVASRANRKRIPTQLSLGTITGVLPIANGGTNAAAASIAVFNNITGYSAVGKTGNSNTNLVFSTSCALTSASLTTPILGTPQSGVLSNCSSFPAANLSGIVTVALGGTSASTASITSFNNITGFSAAGSTGTTSTNLVFSTSPTITNLILAAGTTALPALKFTATSGSVLTTVTAGSLELDGVAFYANALASTRQVWDCEQFCTLTGAYTLVNQTAAQKIFNSSSTGAVTLGGNTTYFFNCIFSLTGLSGSSHDIGFAFGGTATITRQAWTAIAAQATLTTANTAQITYNTAANTGIVTSSVTTTAVVQLYGKLVIATSGTVIPQVSQATNATSAIVGIDSFFRIWPVGSNTVQTVGNWS